MEVSLDPALKIAEFLLKIKAVKLSPNNPFKWASGYLSPIYCDNRKTLSYPPIRTYIRQQFEDVINENFPKPDMIAGVATGGIAHGALVAQAMDLPFIYVRPSSKKHGLQNRVEGAIDGGSTVVVIEDLISTGKSSLSTVEVLRSEGLEVKGMASIFTYAFDEAREAFEKANVPLHCLTTYQILLDQALKSEYITEKDFISLNEWRQSPSTWDPHLKK
jgi:orotate phosphoribosyltransferase